jgi:hypothetical protein
MAATTSGTSAEVAVRQYLLYLEDPAKLRDEGEVQKKTQAVQDAVDPIDKLKAIAERERVANVEEGPLREGFVAHAKAWADQASVPVSGFRDLRVPDDVLLAAGFEVPVGRRRRAGSSVGRQRSKAVPVEEIKNYVLSQTGTFLLVDVMSGVGGSQATVRKAIDELIEAGQVEKLGPMPGHSGRGRAPTQYSHA